MISCSFDEQMFSILFSCFLCMRTKKKERNGTEREKELFLHFNTHALFGNFGLDHTTDYVQKR